MQEQLAIVILKQALRNICDEYRKDPNSFAYIVAAQALNDATMHVDPTRRIIARAMNYVADTVEAPQSITFAGGRTVSIVKTESGPALAVSSLKEATNV